MIFGFLTGLKAQGIHGLWKEVYWGPMTSYYRFDTLTSTFKYYYHDDTHGSFGKGSFEIKGKMIIMDYDSIICDKPIIEQLDNDLINDTTSIAFFHYWGFPKRIDIISNGERIYSNWTTSSDSIIEDYVCIKIFQKLDSIKIEVFESYGSTDKLLTGFSARLYNKPFCNIYYYPCDSWYDYKEPSRNEIKIKWKEPDLFDIKGKFKPMQNPALYNTLARFANFNDAAKIAGLSVCEILHTINKYLGIEDKLLKSMPECIKKFMK